MEKFDEVIEDFVTITIILWIISSFIMPFTLAITYYLVQSITQIKEEHRLGTLILNLCCLYQNRRRCLCKQNLKCIDV